MCPRSTAEAGNRHSTNRSRGRAAARIRGVRRDAPAHRHREAIDTPHHGPAPRHRSSPPTPRPGRADPGSRSACVPPRRHRAAGVHVRSGGLTRGPCGGSRARTAGRARPARPRTSLEPPHPRINPPQPHTRRTDHTPNRPTDMSGGPKKVLDNETLGQWYLRQMPGSANIDAGPAMGFMIG